MELLVRGSLVLEGGDEVRELRGDGAMEKGDEGIWEQYLIPSGYFLTAGGGQLP